jgi:hypothetical protein
VDGAIRWSLYGNTTEGGLAPCLTSNGYISCVTFHVFRAGVQELQQTMHGAERPLLQVALEGLTGMNGRKWKVSESLPPANGIELAIPELQQALMEGLELPIEKWHQLNIGGLLPQHYVQVGNRSLVPRRQRNQKLVKWLKTNGWRMDLATDLMSMDNLFATFFAHSHYFVIHWSKTSRTFTVRDSLAKRTKQEHIEALILLWAILLASARMEGNLWVTEPVLMLSESQVLEEFRELLLHRPRSEWDSPLTEGEKANLRRMGIIIQENTENVTGAWTWYRDTSFPQQSNGNDCGMVAVVTVIHLARGWQLSDMHEVKMNRYRQWLAQVIAHDSVEVFKVPCHRCGTTQNCKLIRTTVCGNKQRCDANREHLQDTVVCEDEVGCQLETSGGQRPVAEVQVMLDNQIPDIDSVTTGIAQLQDQQATGVDETIIDIPASSNKAMTPSPVPEDGSGTWTDRNGALTAESQINRIEPCHNPRGDVNRKKQSPPQEQGPKRQKLLTEDLVISIPNHQPGRQLTRNSHKSKPKPPPRAKLTQGDPSCAKWVCKLLGAKRGRKASYSRGKIPQRCAPNARDCCWIARWRYCAQDAEYQGTAPPPAKSYTGQRVIGQSAYQATPGARRVEKMSIPGQQQPSHVNDARRWCIVRSCASTTTSITTCTTAPWYCLTRFI